MDFKEIMKNHPDEKLIEIVTHRRDDYMPVAIMAAEEELKNRNINLSEIIEGFQIAKAEKNAKKYEGLNENLRPNLQRAKNAITLVWIVLLLEIVSLISGYFQYDLLQTVSSGGEISIEKATANDTREQILGIAYFLAFVISGITFIMWFRRAYFNLHLRVNYLTQSEGWAAGSWFIPIISLFRPYQIMKELYQETKELLIKRGLRIDEGFSTSFLSWWWALWIINSLFGQLVFRYSLKAESIDELTTSTIISMIGNIIGIPLALITVKVIKDYSTAETLLFKLKEED